MTGWGRVKTTGSGRIALRLAIAGMPFEMVTDGAFRGPLTNGLNGAFNNLTGRLAGLLVDGTILAEDVDMPRALHSVQPFSVTLVDVADDDAIGTGGLVTTPWSLLFSKKADNTTWVATTCTDTDTEIEVRNIDGFATSGAVWIDQECITYSGVASSPYRFTGCTRGVAGTIPTYHYSLDTTGAQAAEVTDWPRSMEGRHAFLYAYGPDDNAGGDGDLIWRGIVSRDAQLVEGTKWRIDIDPITRVMEGPFGGDLASPMGARGAYYPFNACLYCVVWVSTTNAVTGLPSTATAHFTITGHYEDNHAFARQFASLLAGTSAAGCGLFIQPNGGSGWRLALQTPSASQKYVAAFVTSPVDFDHGFDPSRIEALEILGVPQDATRGAAGTVSASTVYTFPQRPTTSIYFGAGPSVDARRGPGAIPRGCFSLDTGTIGSPLTRDPTAAATAPHNRIYVSGTTALADIDHVAIDLGGAGGSDAVTVTGALSDHDDAERWIEVRTADAIPSNAKVAFAGAPGPLTTVVRGYGPGTIQDLLTGIINQVAQEAPLGGAPYIYDVSLSGSEALTSDFGGFSAAGTAAISTLARRFWAIAKGQRLGDALREEAKNLGCFFALDADGAIELYQVGIAPTGVNWTIDSSNTLSAGGPPGWERNAAGSVAQIIVSTGYDPIQDKHLGTPITFSNVVAYGRNPSAQPITVEPKSEESASAVSARPWAEVLADYNRVFAGTFSLFSYPYNTITIRVPFGDGTQSFFDARCGDTVALTNRNLPDGDGGRGMVSRYSVIIGRRIDFGQGVIDFTLLSSEVNYAGYTPTSRISSSAVVSGFTYDLTIATPAAGPTRAYSTGAVWKASDVVKVVVWNSTTLTAVLGTVVSNGSASTVRVTLASAIPGGTINLEYAASDDTWTANQQQYTAMADSSARIDYGGPTVAARQFIA